MSRRRPLSRSAPRDQFEALRATEAALREADHRTSSIEMMPPENSMAAAFGFLARSAA